MVRIPFRHLGALALVMFLARWLLPCPFCSALSSTLTEDIKQSHWAFLAVCVQPADISDDTKPPIHQFKLVSRLKSPPVQAQARLLAQPVESSTSPTDQGTSDSPVFRIAAVDAAAVAAGQLASQARPKADEGDIVEVYSLQQYAKKQVVLLLGNSTGELTDWSGSEPLSEAAQAYLQQLVKLPNATEHERLKFFLPSLRSPDKLIATDAYNEFALASLETMNSLKPHLNVQEIVAVIENPTTSAEVRRLHWTLLGICGSSKELAVVERAMASNLASGHGDIGMDAVFSCYLVLGGEPALEKLEREYLSNPEASFTNCFALVGALRVHAEQIQTIQPERICQSFRLALARSNLAELVIPDLARWEDWSVIDQLVDLFARPADGQRQSYKIPIVNYLRNCPLPEARLALAKCEKIDPEAVRRTTVLFPLR